MKERAIAILSICLLVTSFGAAVSADEGEEHAPEAAQTTVKGEILDMACFVSHGAKGEEHADCAKRCVKGGQPMGLLSDDGTVYLLYASHKDAAPFEQAKEHAGQRVEITGLAATKGGLKGIEVSGVKPL